MVPSIRQATPADAESWIELQRATHGHEWIAKLEATQVARQFDATADWVPWVAELDGTLTAAVTCAPLGSHQDDLVLGLFDPAFRPESASTGAAVALLERIAPTRPGPPRILLAQVMASNRLQQTVFEAAGYACVGFQPFKHHLARREGVLCYLRVAGAGLDGRVPLTEALPQIMKLASGVLASLRLPVPLSVLEGVAGYALQTDIDLHDATIEDFELWRLQAQASNPPVELVAGLDPAAGLLRAGSKRTAQAILAQREARIVGGLAYEIDEADRCLRLSDGFASDDLVMGPLMQRAVRVAQDHHNAAYVQADVLMTAPRLIRCAEQLGFAPVAYLPGLYRKADHRLDVVRLVKLNGAYALENTDLTSHAQAIVELIDQGFEDQKGGLPTIELLRSLSLLAGLGDGELRKVARLCAQRLYRPGDRIFRKGDPSSEAFVVMRGQVDLYLDETAKPVASVEAGQIFGEFALVEDAPRNTGAYAHQPSLLLVIQRTAFNDLLQREPQLGVVILRNIALDLSQQLRRASATIASLRQ